MVGPPRVDPTSALGRVAAWVLTVALAAFLILPILALFAGTSLSALVSVASDAAVRTSLGFTLLASGIALAFSAVFGIPLGYLLARRNFPGRAVLASVVTLPVAVPHLIAGLALALLLAPTAPLGALADQLGVPVFFTIWGVVAVMVYVSASYTVLASEISFSQVDHETLEAARTLGATPAEAFVTVSLAGAARGVVGGLVLTWARAVSEIGGFLILAYSVYPTAPYFGPVTSPISVYIYNLYQIAPADETSVSALFLLVAFAIFLSVRFASGSRSVLGSLAVARP